MPRAALLVLSLATPVAGERLADPTRAFVEGYDPSGNDFLANVPERTVLLRIRADFDNDGVDDLALSDSSTWGNAGGQWLLFRGQPDQSYVYWGTLFFSPGAAALRPQAPGTSEMALYVRMSVSRGHRPRVSPDERRGHPRQRAVARPRAVERPRTVRGAAPVGAPARRSSTRKLLEYRRAAATCWQPGLGHRQAISRPEAPRRRRSPPACGSTLPGPSMRTLSHGIPVVDAEEDHVRGSRPRPVLTLAAEDLDPRVLPHDDVPRHARARGRLGGTGARTSSPGPRARAPPRSGTSHPLSRSPCPVCSKQRPPWHQPALHPVHADRHGHPDIPGPDAKVHHVRQEERSRFASAAAEEPGIRPDERLRPS